MANQAGGESAASAGGGQWWQGALKYGLGFGALAYVLWANWSTLAEQFRKTPQWEYLLAAAGSDESFALPEPNAGIAAHLGTVREVISRTLHQFADLGYISVRGRTVTLLDRRALERRAVVALA